MNKLNVSLLEIKEAEKFILINIIGMMEGLINRALTIEECEAYLFNLYSVKILKDKKFDSEIILLVELGCELEDIESLLSEKLLDNINKIKTKACELLTTRAGHSNVYNVKKWIDKT